MILRAPNPATEAALAESLLKTACGEPSAEDWLDDNAELLVAGALAFRDGPLFTRRQLATMTFRCHALGTIASIAAGVRMTYGRPLPDEVRRLAAMRVNDTLLELYWGRLRFNALYVSDDVVRHAGRLLMEGSA